jgi:hypothetical protein
MSAVKEKLVHATFKVNGNLRSEHRFLLWAYFPTANEILLQGFQDYPNGEYIDVLRETGAVIKIKPINRR